MANLFNKKVLKKAVESIQIPHRDEKLAVIKQWFDAHKTGVLQTKTETECEQAFNQNFFVQILGYSTFPNSPYTIDPKGKNELTGQKADAILGYFTTDEENAKKNMDNVQVVVEIKDAKTILDKSQKREGNLTPAQQAHKYKGQYRNCSWFIATNFYEIRLYKDTLLDFELWNLEMLVDPSNDYENFKTFYHLLCATNLISQRGQSNTENLLSSVRIKQEEITKKFYEHYKKLRLELINDIKKNNPDTALDIVINKAQKIIDRIVFVHFCEDYQLLPEGKLMEVVNYAENLGVSIWGILHNYFEAVNSGSQKLGIPDGYNGGLFHTDKVLDNLKVGDDVCRKFVDIGNYDFTNDLSVNILGHIFEQSISDLEGLRIDLLGTEIETGELGETKKHSKRKKEGIFYTPEYIVDYIVRNSLGKYLEEKFDDIADEVGLKDDIEDKNYEKRLKEAYTKYQKVLHDIKVLDPACGSGAFLVKVFDFLLAENQRVGKILGGLFDNEATYKSILQNNIYGVDLNEESVEITKLSLWLKTAEKGKKLADLDGNIKCGNSLIDAPAIAGEKAFDWNKEFETIMKDGGFDVIVGNPPYIRIQNMDEGSRDFFEKNYETAFKNYDIYILFMEKTHHLLAKTGISSYIMPKKFVNTDYGEKIKKFLYEKKFLSKFIDFGHEQIFEDATTYTGIFVFQNGVRKNFGYASVSNPEINLGFASFNSIPYENIKTSERVFGSESGKSLFDKVSKNRKLLDFTNKIFQGLVTGCDAIFILEEKGGKLFSKQTQKFYDLKDDIIYPLLKGSEITRYGKPQVRYKILYPYQITAGKATLIDEDTLKNSYPGVYSYFLECQDILKKREKGKFDNKNWFGYSRNQNIALMPNKKILTQVLAKRSTLTYDEEGKYFFVGGGTAGGYGIILKGADLNEKYILTLLNSSLLERYLHQYASQFRGGYYAYSRATMERLPVKDVSSVQQKAFMEKADKMLHLKKEFHEAIDFVLRFIQSEFQLKDISSKLEKFYELSFNEFVKALKLKALGIDKKADLMQFFDKKKAEVLAIKGQIDATDREIDEMVFDLYGLSEEERKIVLES